MIVEVVADREATERIPDIAEQLAVDDLVQTGWTVEPPEDTSTEGLVLRARKPFFSPDQAEAVLAEVTGPDGVLRDVELTRGRPFGRREFAFDATLDLSGGIEVVGDADLAETLGGLPVGIDIAELEEELGAPVSELTSFTFAVHLPGGTAFNETGAVVTEEGGRQVFTWTGALDDEPRGLAARTRDLAPLPLALAGAAVVAVAAAVVIVLARRGG